MGESTAGPIGGPLRHHCASSFARAAARRSSSADGICGQGLAGAAAPLALLIGGPLPDQAEGGSPSAIERVDARVTFFRRGLAQETTGEVADEGRGRGDRQQAGV
jgi:hypothetical protein